MSNKYSSGLKTTRRDVLKGAGLAALGIGGVSDRTQAARSSKNGWILTHSNFGSAYEKNRRNNTLRDTGVNLRSAHSLEYLGANWNPYTSPVADEQGSWQHSFRLSGLAASIHQKIKRQNNEIVTRSYEPIPTIEATSFTVQSDEPENIAIAPRRDKNLYGFFDPKVLRTALEEVTIPTYNRPTLSSEQQFTSALGRNPGSVVNPNFVRDRVKSFQRAQEESENDRAWITAIIDGLLLILPSPEHLADLYGGITAVIDLLTAVRPEVQQMNQGFDCEYPTNTVATTGHFAYFDIYVPPNQSGTFWVESSFTPDRSFVDPAEIHFDMESTEAWFEPSPRWEIKLQSRQEGIDRSRIEAAEPLRDTDEPGRKTNIPLYRSDPDEKSPVADLTVSSSEIYPQDTLTADASESNSPVGGDFSYFFYAYRAYVLDDGPVPTGGIDDGDNVVRGSRADLTVEQNGDQTFDLSLNVEESSFERHYQIELVIIDERGMSANATALVTVPRTLPKVELDAPKLAYQGDTITLDASETEGAVETEGYEWSVTLVDVGPYDGGGPGVLVAYPESERERGPISIEQPVEWDLTGPTPEHAFDGPLAEKRLVYEVSVTVTSSINPDATATSKRFVTVGPATNKTPSASFTVSGDRTAAKVLSFDASDSSDPNGEKDIVGYDWTVERQDENWDVSLSGETTTFELPCTGTDHVYTITLTVTDDDDASATTTKSIDVPGVEHPGPKVELTADPQDPIVHDDEVTYTADVSNTDGEVTYEWTYSDPGDDTLTFKDGGKTFSRTYHTTGSAFVNVTVEDDCGRMGDDASVDVRSNPEPSVTITGANEVTEGDTVTYYADASDDQPIADYTWSVFHPEDSKIDAGGGSEFTYSFKDANDVTIIVEVTDQDGATASDDVAVSVNDLNQQPSVSLSGPTSVTEGETATYTADANDDDPLTYTWTYGQGTLDTKTGGTDLTYTFSGSTDFYVNVTVEDDDGATDSASKDVTVADSNDAPTVWLSADPSNPAEYETVDLVANADDSDGDTLSYDWDGASISGSSGTESWDEIGTYTVTVTVSDGHGHSASDSVDIDVHDADLEPTQSRTDSPSGFLQIGAALFGSLVPLAGDDKEVNR